MGRAYFTYVWGPPGNPAWPLTFKDKAARTDAINKLSKNDLVFTVGTKGPQTEEPYRGRVLGVMEVSDLEVNTQDYDFSPRALASDKANSARLPFALHPFSVWQVSDPDNLFSKHSGALPQRDYLQAQSKIVELLPDVANRLGSLAKASVPVVEPSSELGRQKLRIYMARQGPQHAGSYDAKFNNHDFWYVYTLLLRDKQKRVIAIKIGCSSNPQDRCDSYNKSMACEVTGLSWTLDTQQQCSSEEAAQKIEKGVHDQFDSNRLPSNPEIFRLSDKIAVDIAIAQACRKS